MLLAFLYLSLALAASFTESQPNAPRILVSAPQPAMPLYDLLEFAHKPVGTRVKLLLSLYDLLREGAAQGYLMRDAENLGFALGKMYSAFFGKMQAKKSVEVSDLAGFFSHIPEWRATWHLVNLLPLLKIAWNENVMIPNIEQALVLGPLLEHDLFRTGRTALDDMLASWNSEMHELFLTIRDDVIPTPDMPMDEFWNLVVAFQYDKNETLSVVTKVVIHPADSSERVKSILTSSHSLRLAYATAILESFPIVLIPTRDRVFAFNNFVMKLMWTSIFRIVDLAIPNFQPITSVSQSAHEAIQPLLTRELIDSLYPFWNEDALRQLMLDVSVIGGYMMKHNLALRGSTDIFSLFTTSCEDYHFISWPNYHLLFELKEQMLHFIDYLRGCPEQLIYSELGNLTF